MVGNIPAPHDLDAEAAVLSALLLASDVVFPKIIGIVRPCDFYSDANRRIAEVAWALRDERCAIDVVTVATRLREVERLQQVGGTAYLALLTDSTPAVAHVDEHASIIRARATAREVAYGALLVAAEARTGADVDVLVTRLRDLANDVHGAGQTQPSLLESRWIDLGNALEFVNEVPAPQTWLLKQWHGGHDTGVLPRGRTGLLTATGGVGKTYALTQLAIAVAHGGFWLETFRAVEAGHVLLALGEEDADEARRRIWRGLNAAGLTKEERQAVASRLHILPLHGVPVALTYSRAHGVLETSEFAIALRDKLNAHGVDWSLVILDPLSRWAGGGVEALNEAATRFVQVVETLTTVRGKPSVVVAHHSSQASTQLGKSDARGVTAIRDGFRWQIAMDAVTSPDGAVDGVILRNDKSNYSLRFRPLILVRNTEPGIEGTLRLANAAEEEALKAALPKERQTAADREQAKQATNRDGFEQKQETVAALLPSPPAQFNRDELAAALQAKGHAWGFDTVRAVMSALIRAGRAQDLSDGRRSSARQWCLVVERDS